MSASPDVPEALESERLFLRAPRVEDTELVYEAVRESLDDLAKWMPWATPDYSLEGCEENTRRAVAHFVTRHDLRYHGFTKTGVFSVSTGLHRIDWTVPKFEIGYWWRRSFQGRGYVTEAVRLLTAMAFSRLGAARVEIRCDDLNERSYRVAERCGFVLEGVLKNERREPDGRFSDTQIYVRTD